MFVKSLEVPGESPPATAPKQRRRRTASSQHGSTGRWCVLGLSVARIPTRGNPSANLRESLKLGYNDPTRHLGMEAPHVFSIPRSSNCAKCVPCGWFCRSTGRHVAQLEDL